MSAIEIIVPIFNAADILAQCLEALHRHAPTRVRLWLANDASTDPRIAPMLLNFQEHAQVPVRILTNPRNLGFIGTVNSALKHTKGHVVLLNSDAILSAGAIEALARAAERVPKLASATPWSNNAEICSFPLFCQNNPVPNALDALAKACASLTPNYPSLPTGVGFCMLMTRDALQRLGDFDHATFGRGYGEENDWCLRAAGMGMRNVLCDNAYVAHIGGQSFSATGERPGGENLRRLLARYPHYSNSVASFIEADPLSAHRGALRALVESGVQA